MYLPPTTHAQTPEALHPPIFAPCLDGTRLGLGGAALGNLYQAISDSQAQALVEAAWSDGCRSFDTAPHYGHGRSEHRLGRVLGLQPRCCFTLSSKVGRLLRPQRQALADQHGYAQTLPFVQHWDFSAAGIQRSVEDSLQRLGLACLDAVYIHDIDVHTHGAQAEAVCRQVLDEALPALAELKSQGMVGHIGLGVNDHVVVARVLAHADLDAVLLAGRYTLLDSSALPELLPLIQQRGVALALGGVFNSGLLAGRIDTTRALNFNYAPAPEAWLERALKLQQVCDRHEVSLAAAALQFALHHPATDLVLLGCRSPQEWLQSRADARTPLPADLWRSLKHQGLLPEQAPVPT